MVPRLSVAEGRKRNCAVVCGAVSKGIRRPKCRKRNCPVDTVCSSRSGRPPNVHAPRRNTWITTRSRSPPAGSATRVADAMWRSAITTSRTLATRPLSRKSAIVAGLKAGRGKTSPICVCHPRRKASNPRGAAPGTLESTANAPGARSVCDPVLFISGDPPRVRCSDAFLWRTCSVRTPLRFKCLPCRVPHAVNTVSHGSARRPLPGALPTAERGH